MSPVIAIAALIALSSVFSAIGVGWTRQIALRQRMIDIPNERSSHTQPTPRGGGLSIVVIVVTGALILSALGWLAGSTAVALGIGAGIALIGYLDDRGGLSPLVRGIVHAICAAAGLAVIGGMPALNVGFAVIEWGIIGHLIGVIGIIWMINLYNFMDGIDGLAGSEAVFVFGMTAVLMLASGIHDLALVSGLVIGACLGFLRWNWPKAKIFMGDVASGFLGYTVAVLAIASAHNGFTLWVWLILIGVFFVDATVTVIRRVLRGEKWYRPHRTHAYQHLTTRWRSHLLVTLTILAIDVVWLGPLALLAYAVPEMAVAAGAAALIPLGVLAFWLGAGQNRQVVVQPTVDGVKS